MTRRDIEAIRRNNIRKGFADVMECYHVSPADAPKYLADAIAKQFEEVKTEIIDEPTLELEGVPCGKCGRKIICNYGKPLCMQCRHNKTLKPCPDCGLKILPASKRCFECNRKHQIGRKINRGKKLNATEK